MEKVLQLFRSMVIELITAIRNSNQKIRGSAEEAFNKMATILSNFKALPQLFQMMLIGLAGQTPQVQSCAIRALIYNLKQSIETPGRGKLNMRRDESLETNSNSSSQIENKLLSSDPQVQDFLKKVTRIVALLLKDQTAPRELHKSVLKFLKIVITYLDFSSGQQEAQQQTELILTHVFALQKPKKYTVVIKRILTKLISRNGLKMVQASTPAHCQKLLQYIERLKRKEKNAKER